MNTGIATTGVLKAAQAKVQARRRMLPLAGEASSPRAQTVDVQLAPLQEAGRWMSETELATLQSGAHSRGVEAGREQARDEALEMARRQASKEFERELAARLAQLQLEQQAQWRRLHGGIAEQLGRLQHRLEAEVTEWAFAAVSRLLGEAPIEYLKLAVRQVLGQARLNQPVTLCLHADDLQPLQRSLEAAPLDGTQLVTLVADERVAVGGCIVEAAGESLDARLEVQLAMLRERLDAARLARRGKA